MARAVCALSTQAFGRDAGHAAGLGYARAVILGVHRTTASNLRATAAPLVRRARVVAATVASHVLLLMALTIAAAQPAICGDALTHAASTAGGTPARVATAVARAAFGALEPAFPQRRSPREWHDANATWLDRRRLLPSGWNESELDPDAWAALLAGLQRPYGVEPRGTSGATDADTLIQEAAAALQAGADAVRPLALIGTKPDDRDAVAFTAVLWNWTPFPRLLLFPPGDAPATISEDGRPSDVLTRLGTCAWRPSAWMTANEDAVADYYFGNVDAGIRIVATDRSVQRRDVPRGDERTVLRFAWDELDGAEVAAVEFTGPGPGVSQVVSLLTRVRTNLGLLDVQRYLAFP